MDFAAQLRESQLDLARSKMEKYVPYMNRLYTMVWFHLVLCEYLDKLRLGTIKNLMVFMPPQHGKSELTSRLFPTYLMGCDPSLMITIASYSADLAEQMSTDANNYMVSEEYKALFPNTCIPKTGTNGKAKNNAQRFDIVDINGRPTRGFLKAVGVGGTFTGTPVDVLIIDDPHKDYAAATSPQQSQGVINWYDGVAKPRTHNNSKKLLIQTRWASDDLAGRLLERMEQGIKDGNPDIDVWTVICFPGIKENDDNPYDPRKIGDALWPEKHSLSKLRGIRHESLRTFMHLYQQNPQPVQAGGECYKMFDYQANTGDYTYNPELPLHFTFDFNVNPYMSCGIWQIVLEEVGDKIHRKAYKIEEVCLRSPNNTTKGICRYIRDKYKHQHLSTSYIYGDPNGMKEDTRSEKGWNDFMIIKAELADFKAQFRVMTKAPAVHTRISFMNSLFANAVNGLEIYIDRKCTNTINDYLYIKEEADGSKQKVKALDAVTGINSEKYGHCCDHDEYFICAAFANQYMRYQQGGVSSNIVVGKRISMYDSASPQKVSKTSSRYGY